MFIFQSSAIVYNVNWRWASQAPPSIIVTNCSSVKEIINRPIAALTSRQIRHHLILWALVQIWLILRYTLARGRYCQRVNMLIHVSARPRNRSRRHFITSAAMSVLADLLHLFNHRWMMSGFNQFWNLIKENKRNLTWIFPGLFCRLPTIKVGIARLSW